jgi:hypothetical protein
MFKEDATATIPVSLDETAMRQRSQELGSVLDDLTKLKEEKKQVNSDFKSREDYIQSQIRRLGEIAKSGIELIETPCVKVYDAENKAVWWETYDGKQYHKREMRDDELQKCQPDLFNTQDEEAM